MGFMDKAKQMADQAQKKIEETQKQFNDSQAQKAGSAGGAQVRYDAHGRPISEGPPASEVPAAPVAPATPDPVAEPGAAPAVTQPQPPDSEEVLEDAPTPPKEGINQSPDPFKPIQ